MQNAHQIIIWWAFCVVAYCFEHWYFLSIAENMHQHTEQAFEFTKTPVFGVYLQD
jgi:hypothetical protein